MTLNQKTHQERNYYPYAGGKVEICGKDIRFLFYTKAIFKNTGKKLIVKKEKVLPDPASSFNRSKKNVFKIIRCNAFEWFKPNGKSYLPTFVTLTFKEDVKDFGTANKIFVRFIQKWNYELFGEKKAQLQYIGVREFQKERGVIHYHIVFFNQPYNRNLLKVWKKGRVDLKAVYSMSGVFGYVSKYMAKEFEDARLKGKKRYFTSKKVKRPIVVKSYFVARMAFLALKGKNLYHKTLHVDFIGKIEFYRYQFQNKESILNFELDQFTRMKIESEIAKQKEKTAL